MKSPELLQLTASEPLTLEQEYDMQRSWREDGDSKETLRSHIVQSSVFPVFSVGKLPRNEKSPLFTSFALLAQQKLQSSGTRPFVM